MPRLCANRHKPVWYGAASCRGRCARSAIGRSSSEPCLLSSDWSRRRPSPRTRAPLIRGLTQQNADLAARSRGVVLELYSLDSRLARERTRLVELRIRTAEVKGRARGRPPAAPRRPPHAQGLGAVARLRACSCSTSRATPTRWRSCSAPPRSPTRSGNLDSLDRIADQDRVVIEQTQHAKHTAAALTRGLAAKEQHLRGLAQEASQSTLVLEQSRSQRASYLATLASQQKLNAAVDRRVPAAGARRRGEGPRGLGRRRRRSRRRRSRSLPAAAH